MIEVYAGLAIGLFGAGAIIGGLVIIAVGIRLDGKRRSLTISDPSRIAVGTRAWVGVRTTPRYMDGGPYQGPYHQGPYQDESLFQGQRASVPAGRGPMV